MATETRAALTYASAQQQLSRGQKIALVGLGIALILGLLVGLSPLAYLRAFIGVVTLAYLTQFLFNNFLILTASTPSAERELNVNLTQLDLDALPSYSVMVPLFKETAVVEHLIHHLSQLKYPPQKLQIMLLLEEDDDDMIAAVCSRPLPPGFEVVIVPRSLPRTKPKALNIGLRHVRGELCTIYDAEDRPDPLQLIKAVAAFEQSGSQVACIQGTLAYHNPRQNLLTRFFASEYSNWFQLYVPGLARHGLLFLLGGTSNHFKTAVLRKLGGWDAYNVTEDADLGIRLARAGYQVRAMSSVTWEEANSHGWNWIRQRSRWSKGYMQTYLVHMRDPLRLLRELGWARFVTFQIMVGIAPLTNLINPLFWGLTAVYWLTRSPFIEDLYPGAIFYVGSLLLFMGNYIGLYVSMSGALIQGQYASIKYMLLAHGYWLMMSVAAWRALGN